MTLKEKLEDIWRDDWVRCPSHRVLWSKDHGFCEDQEMTVFWTKGKKTEFKGGNKKKGYSFLSRNYHFVWSSYTRFP
jgi:hypothetical protein